ncbi:MAG: LysM peptidoglycan-binding domain-containing protein [Polyangiales bacterium]|nr:LysM peptidoglycan-binding domain-containing protein [Myxococcales bacterium]
MKGVHARLLVALVVLASLGAARTAAAQRGFQHVVREGETLASIAQQYYGDPKREEILVAENGLIVQGGATIASGMRLVIPWVEYHRVEPGETWTTLAERFYGDPRRAFLLIDANHGSARTQPSVGGELLVPYPLRFVAGQNDTAKHIVQTFYDGSKAALKTLTRFNGSRLSKIQRGQIILVPLLDLALSEEGKHRVEATLGQELEGGEVRALQEWADQEIPKLGTYQKEGKFAECVTLANRLMGTQKLAATQIVTIQRALGHAYVALGRPDLAAESFREALRLQPDMSLGPRETSPTVLRAYEAGKQMLAKEAAILDAAEPVEEPSAD